jgi:hypothetical protein
LWAQSLQTSGGDWWNVRAAQEDSYRNAQYNWKKLEDLGLVSPGYKRWNDQGIEPTSPVYQDDQHRTLLTEDEWERLRNEEDCQIAQEVAQRDAQWNALSPEQQFWEKNKGHIGDKPMYGDTAQGEWENPGIEDRYRPPTSDRVDGGNYGVSHPDRLDPALFGLFPGGPIGGALSTMGSGIKALSDLSNGTVNVSPLDLARPALGALGGRGADLSEPVLNVIEKVFDFARDRTSVDIQLKGK